MIDSETKALAAVALKNCLYRRQSELMAAILEAAEGLGTCGEYFMDSYAFGSEGYTGVVDLEIWSGARRSETGSLVHKWGHKTILEALQKEEATEVCLDDIKVFERRDGEWFYVEGEN